MSVLKSPHVATAFFAVLLFALVSIASGKLEVVNGLGWDGFIYGRMVTGDLADASPNARVRPLVVLLTRIPYYAGIGLRDSFELLNYVYAFALYFLASLLLKRYGAPDGARAMIVVNLALCIATAKTFGFYPGQVDLGALAFTMLAFYLASTDRRWPAGAACVLAAASREFGVAASVYGLHRSIRQRAWTQAIAYVPGVVTFVVIRWWSSTVDSGQPFSSGDAVQNLQLWAAPAFVGAFVYFAVTVFGGISMLLVTRARESVNLLRREPELATFLLVIVTAAVVGNLDIWRYLAFALPVVLALVAHWFGSIPSETGVRRAAIVMTLCTVLTQRPFEQMDVARYFRDWFPLYYVFGVHPAPADLVAVWGLRAAFVMLLLAALVMTSRRIFTQRAPEMTPGTVAAR